MRVLIKNANFGVSILLILAAIGIAYIATPFFGNQALIVRSGSMQPAIKAGDLVVVNTRVNRYQIGDIVAFKDAQDPKLIITHRVVLIETKDNKVFYQTKGDANNVADNSLVSSGNIIGKATTRLPYIGRLFAFAKSRVGFASLVIFPAILVIIFESLNILKEIRKRPTVSNKKSLPTFTDVNYGSDQLHLPPLVEIINPKKENTKFPKVIPLTGLFGFKVLIPLAICAMVFQNSFAFFTDTAISSNNTLIASNNFPSPTPSPTPTPTPTPSPTPSPIADHVVINEVYYQVDVKHGLDSPVDRGVKVNGVSISIRGNGAGSTNQAFVDIENKCQVVQSNQVQIGNNINVGLNSGNNSASGNTGGNVSIKSGSANAQININNQVNQNNSGACPKVQNDEWIELFNPTEQIISLKNWTISDNSGISRTIPGNQKLNPGQFALISRDDSTWKFWKVPSGALKIPLGKQIGDGLDNAGDRLILKSDKGTIIDELSYGDDTTIFNPSVPLVSLGASFERLVAGFDTDMASDFKQQSSPTPGK